MTPGSGVPRGRLQGSRQLKGRRAALVLVAVVSKNEIVGLTAGHVSRC